MSYRFGAEVFDATLEHGPVARPHRVVLRGAAELWPLRLAVVVVLSAVIVAHTDVSCKHQEILTDKYSSTEKYSCMSTHAKVLQQVLQQVLSKMYT